MRCPDCGAEVRDEDALFCARCGRALADPQGSVTESIDVEASHTTEFGSTREVAEDEAGSDEAEPAPGSTAPAADGGEPRRPTFPVRDLLDSLVRSLRSGGWGEATLAALIAFAGLLLV